MQFSEREMSRATIVALALIFGAPAAFGIPTQLPNSLNNTRSNETATLERPITLFYYQPRHIHISHGSNVELIHTTCSPYY